MPINVTMPALSPTMTEGNLAKWLKKEGDKVAAGDVIAEIETDKATMEVEAVDEGTIGKIVVPEGTEGVAVNTVIAVLLEEGEDSASITLPAAGAKPSAAPAPTTAAPAPSAPVAASPAPAAASAANTGDRIFASPLAKRIAADKGVDLAAVKGSGPHGRIVKADVENAKPGAAAPSKSSAAADVPQGDEKLNEYGMIYTESPNNNIKKVSARRLLESKTTVPHFYLSVEFRLDALMKARAEINEGANGAYKLSVNDFIIKACAMALKSYPKANVQWTEAATRMFKHSDISVAVATPNGLITPIIKKAETKGLKDISNEMKELAGRAREGKLKPEEFQGGTFSISNLGMFGIDDFAAIVNPPQSCILAVGAGVEKPFVEKGEVKIGTFMRCTLSTDHRTVDGAVGAEFLQVLKQYIENPVSMLV
ncbi:MAG: pyruvate dehydrogenase complex dihydrolipoamide acetyltransferase [Alphaproteobacteria bacterium]|nr:pyruvate dehydrogenase complex dihydrolipoamide acetyltransferase [Alphaproteobacteria bacterium]MCD8570766.1 pyruvate dehydrogenase complex dihydrolipoamide acetyltransferase [Alphaproteobacteria bacterium]